MWLAQWIIGIITAYFIIGAVFALLFVTVGVSRVDPAASGAGIGFRLLLVPGAMALWPVLMRRWMAGRLPKEQNAHRRAAQEAPR